MMLSSRLGLGLILLSMLVSVGFMGCEPGEVDSDVDFDGVVDEFDNCPTVANPNQTDSDGDGVGNACEPVARGVVVGQVSDVTGLPLAAVAVYLSNGLSASTDDYGFFSFDDVEGAEVVAEFSKFDYAPTSKRLPVQLTGAPVVDSVIMAPAGSVTDLTNLAVPNLVSVGKSTVLVPPNAVVDANGALVNGPVQLTVTYLDPSTTDVLAFPGSFQVAQQANGFGADLESFGFAAFELSKDGEPVNLAPGKPATIEFILPDNVQDEFLVGDTIGLWEFDDATAIWHESGQGLVGEASDGSGRLAWVALVDHFSWWNADAPLLDKSCLSGRVVSDGEVVSGATITVLGISYNGTSTTQTDLAGEFCVDVKRGSTVLLEVTLNGSAIPLISQEVTVADVSADCSIGPCTDVGDLNISFDSCVHGYVTDSSGNLQAGVTVFVSPGGTAVTDSNGFYCAKAPFDFDVYVFAVGRPAVKVRTPVSASCPAADCARADLTLTLPRAGDVVGTLSAGDDLYIDFPNGIDPVAYEGYNLAGLFFTANFDDLEYFNVEGLQITTEDFGECKVTTYASTYTFDPENPGAGSDAASWLGFGALDPGNPGLAGNGAATVELLRGDPNITAPPTPFYAGIFSPLQSSDELLALGFTGGQTVDFAFPGGVDIGAFNTFIEVPEPLDLISPDLTDPLLEIETGVDLELSWIPGHPQDIVEVSVIGSWNEEIDNGDGTTTYNSETVSIDCEFPDDGSGFISADLLSMLPPDRISTSLIFVRSNEQEVSVPLNRVNGQGIVLVRGTSQVSRHSIIR